jgi:hypothetical protein
MIRRRVTVLAVAGLGLLVACCLWVWRCRAERRAREEAAAAYRATLAEALLEADETTPPTEAEIKRWRRGGCWTIRDTSAARRTRLTCVKCENGEIRCE